MALTTNPFNPTLPASPNEFVGRKEQIKLFEERLASTINASPMSLAIVGNRGIGKTSLLAKYAQMAKEKKCFVVRFSPIETNMKTLEDLSTYIISQIEYQAYTLSKLGKLRQDILSILRENKLTLKTGYDGIEFEAGIERTARTQPILREDLEDIWKKLKDEVSAIVIIIDEAETLEPLGNPYMFLREVFSRLGEDRYPYMLVLGGKLTFPQKLTGEFSPLLRFFHPETLEPLSEGECVTYIKSKLGKSSLSLEDDLIRKIYTDSQGHPYVLAVIMHVLYREFIDEKTKISLSDYDAIKLELSKFITQEFFSPLYSSLTPGAREILGILADTRKLEFRFNTVVEMAKKDANKTSPYLAELVRKGCLDRLSRGHYKIFHELFRQYVSGQRIAINKESLVIPTKISDWF